MAEAFPGVEEVRSQLLGGSLLAEEQVGQWLEERSSSAPAFGRRRFIEYLVPDKDSIQRVLSTAELEPLRTLSERLGRALGSGPHHASVFVLTGALYTVVPARVHYDLILPHNILPPPRLSMPSDLDQEPEVGAQDHRAIREEHGFGKREKADTADRFTVLGEFAEEHECGTRAYILWNNYCRKGTYPAGWRYSDRRTFHRAAKKALRRAQEREREQLRERLERMGAKVGMSS